MSNVNELRKMFQNKMKKDSGPPIKFEPPKVNNTYDFKPKQDKQIKPSQAHEKVQKKQTSNIPSQSNIQEDPPRISVKDLKKNLEGRISFGNSGSQVRKSGVPIMPLITKMEPLQPILDKKQDEQEQTKQHSNPSKKESQKMVMPKEENEHHRQTTFSEAKNNLQKLGLGMLKPPVDQEKKSKNEEQNTTPKTPSQFIREFRSNTSYINIMAEKQQEKIDERVQQILYRIFLPGEEVDQPSEVPNLLRLRSSNKNAPNLGRFDDH